MKFLDSETNHDGNKYPGRMRFHNSLDPVKKKKKWKDDKWKGEDRIVISIRVCDFEREISEPRRPEYITTTYCSI